MTHDAGTKTILIDNYDSFTWNVYQYLSELGADVVVYRNDQVTMDQIIAQYPRNIVISPGPGKPADSKIALDVIRYFAGKIPIMGVCLGEQCMFELFGGVVTYAGEIVHGKTSPISHDGQGMFKDVPQSIQVTRYHSLAGDPKTLPSQLKATAFTESGLIMGVRHVDYTVEGVQFHPESIASEFGKRMFANFLQWEGGHWKDIAYRHNLVNWQCVFDAESIIKPEKQSKAIPIHGLNVSALSQLNSTKPLTNSVAKTADKQSILQRICQKRMVLIEAKKQLPGQSMQHLERLYAMGGAPKVMNLYEKLKEDAVPVAVMAEVKRASPSKKDICPNANAASQALCYAEGGASVISVLTEPEWFKGSLEDMRCIRVCLDNRVNRPAILCKEFIVDIYQILEARLMGADSCLLIVATIPDDATLVKWIAYARQLGMEPLVEVATQEETLRAVTCGAKIIGINNRDLHTFTVDSQRTVNLSHLIPKDVLIVALSGIQGYADVQKYMDAGAKAVLVGESLMRASNKTLFVKQLRGESVEEEMQYKKDGMSFKFCGLRTAQDVAKAIELKATFIGLIFAPSPRQLTVTQAKEATAMLKPASLLLPWEFYDKSPTEWYTHCAAYIRNQQLTLNRPLVVGVFSNASVQDINDTIDEVGLDLVQLHGDEDVSMARLIKRPCIKAFHILENESVAHLIQRIRDAAHAIALVLLDTGVATQSQQGGSGKTFDWSIAKQVAETLNIQIMVAGGLVPTNLSSAMQHIGPSHIFALDCSSGIESTKGIKDYAKMQEFARQCE